MKLSRVKKCIAVALAGTSFLFPAMTQADPPEAVSKRPQTVVMTDGEVDDMDSFLRFLLYTNELDVRGIVYTASMWHYRGDGKGTEFTTRMDIVKKYHPGYHTSLRWCGTDWIDTYLDHYEEAYPTLVAHDARYPKAGDLRALVKIGNIDFEGDMKEETEGSKWIESLLMEEDAAPIYFETWGGANTFARALLSIEERYGHAPDWEAIKDRVSRKAVLYNIMDQDDTYQTYIKVHWPKIRVLFNSWQFGSLAYIWPRVVPESQQKYFRGAWMKEHILKGPIGSHYMTYGDGHKLEGDPEDTFGSLEAAKRAGYGKYDLISEGDSPSFLFLVPNGLRSEEDGRFGGWSGRLSPSVSTPSVQEDNIGSYDYNPETGKRDKYYSQTRWIGDFQNDFAARIDWTMKPYGEANHAPVVEAEGACDFEAKEGALVKLGVRAKDPDGDTLSYRWYPYEEGGTYLAPIELSQNGSTAEFAVPENAKSGDTIHIICAAEDSGTPPLTRYVRFVITVR